MSREQRPGDWAAWMGDGGAAASASVPGTDGEPAVASPADPPSASPAAPPPASPAAPPSASPAASGDDDLEHQLLEGDEDYRRSPRREATRQRVLDAAREVFADQGVMGATVEAICERAGFTRGAFYSNFADKDDVIDALVEREQNRLLEHLEAIFGDVGRQIATAPDLHEVLAGIIDRVMRAVPMDRELSLVQAELETFAIRRPELAGRFLAINRRFRARISGFIADAMTANGRELLVDPLMLTDALIGISQRSGRRAMLDGHEDPNELARVIMPGLLLTFSRPVEATPAS
jgi:AcrR family transcriptional regulator